MYDIIIIGSGPAGLTTAIYALRGGKTALIAEKSTFGGQITFSPKIENYPAFAAVSGPELADMMVSQAIALGADIEPTDIRGIKKEDDGTFTLVSADGESYSSRAVIIASGAEHRRLGLDGEDELIGHGVSFCAVCDGAFFAGGNVAVVGGGNSAAVEATQLAETSAKVTVVQNLPALTCDAASAEGLKAKSNVDVICSTVVTDYIKSSDGTSLAGLRLRNVATGETSELPVDGVFLAVGLAPSNGIFSNLVELDERGYVVAGESCATSCPGLFAAGDCRTKSVRQITTATADGATAALAAMAYIDSL